MKFSFRPYSKHQIENWANSNRIVIYESREQLYQFIQDAVDGKNLLKKMYFGTIPHDLAQKIQNSTGLNVEGYNCSLAAQEIRKIFKDHGTEKTEKPRGQRPITADDIANIPEIIQEPDSINRSPKDYNNRPVIRFIKETEGRTTVTAYISGKHLDLSVQTMFSGNKKRNLATPTDEQASANTPEANNGTVPNSRVHQTEREVKGETQKFSKRITPEMDEKYMNAVRDGDMETAQRMLDEAAEICLYDSMARLDEDGDYWEGEGTLAKVSHATSGTFTVFDRELLGEVTDENASNKSFAATAHLGFFFNTQDLKDRYGYKTNSVNAYLRARNIRNVGKLQYLVEEVDEHTYEDVDEDGDYDAEPKEIAQGYIDFLKEEGYDGIVFEDEEFSGITFVVLSPEQIKSADPVTYDDNGDVIPLSERFDEGKKDIRYSRRLTALDALRKDNERLEERVAYWKGQNNAPAERISVSSRAQTASCQTK